MSRIIIGALSGWAYHDRRERCLATWMHDAAELEIDALFLLGCPPLKKPERIGLHFLTLPCPDDYPTLPQRTMWFCRWALERDDWDYLFKCDDDTYVSVPRLADYNQAGRDYLGAEHTPAVRYGSGGAGYFLSRKAAAIVAERLANVPTGAEDDEVGKILRNADMPVWVDARFTPWGNAERRPRRDNDIITLHGVNAELFLKSHQETGLHAISLSALSSP